MTFRNAPRDRRLATLALLLLLALPPALAREEGAAAARLAPQLVAAYARDAGPLPVLVLLRERADLAPVGRLSARAARGAYVAEALRRVAATSQAAVRRELERLGVASRPLWIVNAVAARLDEPAARRLAALPEVDRILLDLPFRVPLPRPGRSALATRSTSAVEPNLVHVGAPAFWQAGIIGQGAVVGIADTGVDFTHPALAGSYRGGPGPTFAHDRHWFDGVTESEGDCAGSSPAPCDDDGHGTHVTGIVTGDDGGDNRIGMAPGARWIACRNMDRGDGTIASYLACFQFFLAPTTVAGDDPRPDLAPDVVNNSWVCPPSEGCTDPGVLDSAVDALRAAGIAVVAAAGNSGPTCATVSDPPAIYDGSLTVGATGTSSDGITSFSSRGPVVVDGSWRLKPDLVAPGQSIRSSLRGGGYGFKSGTSMAAPHVAGLLALTVSAAPSLRGDVDRLESLLRSHAVPLFSSQGCGGLGSDARPNHVYGWGAVRSAVPIFLDGFESGGTDVWSAFPLSR